MPSGSRKKGKKVKRIVDEAPVPDSQDTHQSKKARKLQAELSDKKKQIAEQEDAAINSVYQVFEVAGKHLLKDTTIMIDFDELAATMLVRPISQVRLLRLETNFLLTGLNTSFWPLAVIMQPEEGKERDDWLAAIRQAHKDARIENAESEQLLAKMRTGKFPYWVLDGGHRIQQLQHLRGLTTAAIKKFPLDKQKQINAVVERSVMLSCIVFKASIPPLLAQNVGTVVNLTQESTHATTLPEHLRTIAKIEESVPRLAGADCNSSTHLAVLKSLYAEVPI